MREAFIDRKFSQKSLDLIFLANNICAEYAAQGFDLTLRQLYYQFVARGLLNNKDTEYKRLGSVINDARLTGDLDWDYIVDRTRFLRAIRTWETPGEAVTEAAERYAIDVWDTQPYRPEVWIEKDALIGVISGVCNKWRVPFFSCRGYVSLSEMYEAAQRHGRWPYRQKVVIFHLGDHDPSGIDMTRDIQDRLDLLGAGADVRRIGLTMDQVRALNPPPNPAKLTDARAQDYIARYGPESWELDALDPATMSQLIEQSVLGILDQDAFDERAEVEQQQRRRMREMASQIS